MSALGKRRSERRSEWLLSELLSSQGWDERKPPRGNLFVQGEYRDEPILQKALKGKSKSGNGHAIPEAILFDPVKGAPLAVIEAKASTEQIDLATSEAENYANALISTGYSPLAIGLAGTDSDEFALRVMKWSGSEWTPVTYEKHPISWIPNPEDLARVANPFGPSELRPTVPPASVLAEKADEINRLLREADIKDEYRPTHVAAVMLALWHSKGNIRRDQAYILRDINAECRDAFVEAGKAGLSNSLRIDTSNTKLRKNAIRIAEILDRLNVTVLTAEHDYLGQLYETFFRYTGGNTIGQYFTPRHIARFMTDVCDATSTDTVVDIACGTGGFFVAYMSRLIENENMSRERMVEIIQQRIFGFESEPNTAALCVANMILRGDGSTQIRQANSLGNLPDFPYGRASVALMNPPFPHKKTDEPVEAFIERGLEALGDRGRMAVIVPQSLLSKGGSKAIWREKILAKNSLIAVCQLPDELFQPFASVTTSIVVLEKGRKHEPKNLTSFVRLQHDGLVLRKSVRVPRQSEPNQIPEALDAIRNKTNEAGFSAAASISKKDEWSAGAYIESRISDENLLKETVDVQMRRLASFYTRYAREIVAQRDAIANHEIGIYKYRDLLSSQRLANAKKFSAPDGKLGSKYDIYYGLKELHSRDGIGPGKTLIISPTEEYNGTYGWLDFDFVLEPNFVSVAQTGSIGEAFVQLEPCAVNDDCLIIMPRDQDTDIAELILISAMLHLERWRFNYGRKLTPARIYDFEIPQSVALRRWVLDKFDSFLEVIDASLAPYDPVGASAEERELAEAIGAIDEEREATLDDLLNGE